MAETYVFEKCGCRFDVIGPPIYEGGLPLLNFDIRKVPMNCRAVWDLLSTGATIGCFQLEKQLGSTWSRKLRPESIEHLGALGALLRPGALGAKDEEGVSMTEHYCRRKNGEEEVSVLHPALESILDKTYGVPAFQENALRIGRELAGFDLVKTHRLQKAISKKNAAEMYEVGKVFIADCKEKGVVDTNIAEQIWGWIVKSARYSFCRAHAITYGFGSYETAYFKAHFPLQFFASWLSHAKGDAEPRQAISELVFDARRFGISVLSPDLCSREKHFFPDGPNVRFGLCDIKGMGDAAIAPVLAAVNAIEEASKKAIQSLTWLEFLLLCGSRVSTTMLSKLAEAGALGWFGRQRAEMLADLDAIAKLTDLELAWLVDREVTARGWTVDRPAVDPGDTKAVKAQVKRKAVLASFLGVEPSLTLPQALRLAGVVKKNGGAAASEKRAAVVQALADLLENPPTKREDAPHWLVAREEELLGVSLTCTRLDDMDTSLVDTTCKEFLSGKRGLVVLGVEIKDIRPTKTKTGRNPGASMAHLAVADATSMLPSVVVFPDAYQEFGSLLVRGNSVILQGERDRKNDSLLVKRIWQAQRM